MNADHWKQFSLYPPGGRNRFQPLQVLHSFLPAWISRREPEQWHVLFEPSALVRFRDEDPERTLQAAEQIAVNMGLTFERGDCSADIDKTLRWPGEDYHAEIDESGYTKEEWAALARYLQATSEYAVMVATITDPQRQLLMTRKAIHLALNPMGLNYLEEATVCRMHADRMVELTKEHYRK